MDRDRLACHQPVQPFDVLTEEISPNVVLVVVRDESAHDLHPVLLGQVDQLVDVPRGIDDERLARVCVADEIGQIGHLAYRTLPEVQISFARG